MEKQTYEVKIFNKPDKTAPRFRKSKFRHNIVSREMYENFIKDTGKKVSWNDFKAICISMSKVIIGFAEQERMGVILPENVGTIQFLLIKMSKKALDIRESEKLGRMVYFPQLETNGFTGKIAFNNMGIKYKTKGNIRYMFVPHRDFKKIASNNFIQNPEKYKKLDYENEKKIKFRNEQKHQRASE